MAEKIVSPGVFTRENDLSFLQTGIAAIGMAFVGPFKEGPLVPTVVNTQSEFEQLYGTVDDTYYTPIAVVNYLREAGQAVVARVTGFGGYTQTTPKAITDTNSSGTILGILFSTSATGSSLSGITITDGGGTPAVKAFGSDSSITSFTAGNTVVFTSGSYTASFIAYEGSSPSSTPPFYDFATGSNLAGGLSNLANAMDSALNGIVDVNASATTLFVTASTAGTAANGWTIIGTSNSISITLAGGAAATGGGGSGVFTAGNVGGETYTDISVFSTQSSNIGSVFGSDPQGGKAAYGYAYFPNKADDLATTVVSSVDLDNQIFPEEASEAKTPYILSQDISGQRYKLFRFETISGGTAANTKIKVGITSIKAAGTVPGTNYSTFTVVVRRLDDTNRRKVAIESYSNVTLDPNSVNYINRVIGDRKVKYNDNGKVTETGDWINRSKYIRMVSPQEDSELAPENIPVQCAPFGHDKYYSIITGTENTQLPPVTFTSGSSSTYGGIDLDNNSDNLNYLKPIPIGANDLPETGSNTVFGLDTTEGGGLTLSSATQTEIAKRNFLVAFQGGFDGQSPAIKNLKGDDEELTNTQGFDCSQLTSSGSVAYLKQFAALSNAEEFDIQLMVTPGLNNKNHSALIDRGLDMIQDRADAFYIIDPTPIDGEINDAIEEAKEYDSNYAAMYYPWVKTLDPITGKLISVPPSTLLPAVYAANDRSAAEWFAPAGLNRGGLSSAVAVIRKCNQEDRDNLYEGKVNPIIIFANQGVVAFGQKTLQSKPSALDRINVRRLLLTIRKFVASTSRYLVFEQNTSTTRQRFVNIVNPYLETIQQRQGLYAFKVVMDESNNTPDMIDRNFLNGSIYLQPTRTAEFIQIDFNILPTGATFGG